MVSMENTMISPRVDIRAEHVVHMEIFEIIETPCLTGDEQHRLAAMAVDLELHFAVQVVGIAFVITNFHGLILLIHSWEYAPAALY